MYIDILRGVQSCRNKLHQMLYQLLNLSIIHQHSFVAVAMNFNF